MPQFLTVVNRALIIGYIICVLPLAAGFISGHPVPVVAQAPWAHFIETERQNILAKSKIMTLNLYMPADFVRLYTFLRPETDDHLGYLNFYVRYFQQVTKTLPPAYTSDAYAMLGFCYFHQNKIKESYDSYVKSLEENPVFLWTYYNLAVIEFKGRQYDKAVLFLSQMLKTNPEVSLKVISSSKIYTDVLRDNHGTMDLSQEIKATYGDAMRMMVISLYQLKKFPEVLNSAQYAVASGFEPAVVFNYYAGLASDAVGDASKAAAFRQVAGPGAGDAYTGQNIAVRFF